jgi:choline dehydrogenase-like flavoprotein
MYMHCVIGSGPAGAACAKALLARGAEVLMLDAGIELEPQRVELVRKLGSSNISQWMPEDIATLKGGMHTSSKRVPQKLVFGSNYPYREADEHIPCNGHGATVNPSLALGGFSTVWGAAVLPYRDEDLENWPIKSAHLMRHYRAVLEFSGFAGRRDDLEELFPLHCENPKSLRLSRQAEILLNRLARHGVALRESGWRFGQARLAVRATDTPEGAGCVYCGMCLYGCSYGHIYNSADTVREMRSDSRFKYQRDVIVTKLREDPEAVFIEGYHRQTRQPLSFEANRVYLAAGVVPTTKILLRSQNAYDRPVRARDSQYFLFPLLMARRVRDVRNEPAYTLSQLFIELNNRRISRHTVHLQIYTYNDIIARTVQKSLGPLKMFARLIEERILIVQCFLHSDESPEIEMTLKRDGPKDVLLLETRLNPETRRVVRRTLREFLRNAPQLGAIPLIPMLELMRPGQGFHSGGTFPMRAQPKAYESDCLGRPRGWARVHAVDATVFPSLPATTITFPVMANAHRIGWETAGMI